MKYTQRQGLYELKESMMIKLKHSYPTVINQHGNVSGYTLYIRKGFHWNGSDVVNDLNSGAKASMVHDFLCDLFEKKLLTDRKKIDDEYNEITKQEGMNILSRNARKFGLYLHRIKLSLFK